MDSFESRMNPRFLAESKKAMLWELRVIESGRETVEGFKEDQKGKRRPKGKEKSFYFIVIQFELIFGHPCFYAVCVPALSSLVRLVTSLREADFWRCVSFSNEDGLQSD